MARPITSSAPDSLPIETVESVCARCERLRLERQRLRSDAAPRPVLGVRGYEQPRIGCNPLDYGESTSITIRFVRHGESCANLMKSQLVFGALRKTQYKDPELTRRGQLLALERGRQLGTDYTGRGRAPIICSSQLLRAIQTADAIDVSGRIFVLPFIQESGVGQDNEAFTPMERTASPTIKRLIDCLAHGPPDYSYFDAAKKGSEPNPSAFLRWLQCNVKNLMGPSLPADVDMIVVTHSNFLNSLMAYLRGPSVKFDNLDMIDVGIRIDSKGTQLVRIGSLQKFDPDGSRKRSIPVAPDNCRFKITGTDETQRLCPARPSVAPLSPPSPSGLNTEAGRPRPTVGADTLIESYLPRNPMLGLADDKFTKQIQGLFMIPQNRPNIDTVFVELNQALDTHRRQVEEASLAEAEAVGRREEAEVKRQEWLARYESRRAEIQRAYEERLAALARGGARRKSRRHAVRGPARKRLTAHHRRAANRRRTTRQRRQ